MLIADHDEFEAKGIQWLIESSISNVQVKVTTNLIDTISVLENDKPDIFIYEMNIGSEDFFNKVIKIIEPIIISLTMEATFEAAKKAIDIGTKCLLIKPFSPQELLNHIHFFIRELDKKKQNIHATPTTILQEEVVYDHLFLEENKTAERYVFIAFQLEKTKQLSKFNLYLKDYLFPVPPSIFPLSDMTICLFDTKTKIDWDKICKRFMHDWQETEHEPLCIIINSETNPDITIHEKYLHTKKMTEVTFFVGYQQVLSFNKELQWRFIDPFLTPNEQRQWIRFLNERNKEGISDFLVREFLKFTDSYPDPSLLRIRLTSILAQIRRHMKSANIDQNIYEQEYLKIFDRILYEPLIFRIVQKLMIFTTKILDAVLEISKSNHLDIIEKCLHYIELNFWKQNLDLTDLANFVGRNPTYLSHLFVEKTNKTFRESLTECRMNEAKKLLVETDMSIKEISALTGFQNQHYFSKVFKNSVGKSPKQFRMLESAPTYKDGEEINQ